MKTQHLKLWFGFVALGAMALCLAWTWRFTLPSQPLSKTHFQQHRASLEALRVLLQEEVRPRQMDFFVSQERSETETKLPLPEERASRYRALLLKADVDYVATSEMGSRLWVGKFNHQGEYIYFQNWPTRSERQHNNCVLLRDRWYLCSSP